MHFFHLIQQSSRHIYHSALPLSPKSSPFRSIISQQTTLVAGFHGCLEAWGAAIQTIKASSGRFTHMTTFGPRIVAACDDGTVGIYDSVTGALRLSLNPGDLVTTMGGSPDGSMLFCAHQQLSITVWDIQTGGLVHTFVPEGKAEDIAVSLTGRYLACGLSDGSVKIWEVANKAEVSNFNSGSPAVHLCWLEPAEQLAVASEESVRVWDVFAGKALRSFVLKGSVRGVAYAQKLGKFAIVTTSGAESVITFVDSQTRTPFLRRTPRQISCFTFSQITKELVCGMTAPGLGLFSVPACRRRKFDHPAMITSVSVLPNGTAVANVTGSGIQLLSLDKRYTPPRQPTTSMLTVHPLDEGRIIAIIPANRDRIILLESATMSTLLTIPVRTYTIPTDGPPVVCASLKHRIACCPFGYGRGTHLEMWRFGDKSPMWMDFLLGRKLVGGISPSGSRLVVMDDDGSRSIVWVWNTGSGEREAVDRVGSPWPTHPLEIRFESEDEFFSHHDSCHISFVIPLSKRGSSSPSHSVIRREQLPLAEWSQRYYDVDNAREWVVYSSKRICWIPLGFIGSAEHSYCWAGNMLVMVGQDGVLRKFTLRDRPRG